MTDVQKRPKQKDAGILDSPEKNSSMLKHCSTRLFCSKLSIRSTYIIAHLSKKGNGNRWRSAGIFAALRDQAGTEKPSNLPGPAVWHKSTQRWSNSSPNMWIFTILNAFHSKTILPRLKVGARPSLLCLFYDRTYISSVR